MNNKLVIGQSLLDTEEDIVLKASGEAIKTEVPEVDEYTASETSSSSPIAHSPFVAAPVKLEEEIPETPLFLEVTCGALTGILHTAHFTCPGIRVPCIEVSDEPGKLLTPVDFTVKAEKSRQKDWKGAIKHNGRMLRTLMEYDQIDFFNHKYNCSAKCHSRNYITSKCERTDSQKPQKSQKNAKPYDRPAAATPPRTVIKYEELLQNPQIQAYILSMLQEHKKKEIAEGKLRQQKKVIIQNILTNDPNSFFATVVQSNQITHVMTSILQHIGLVAQNLANKVDFKTNAIKMSRIMQVLGMTEQVVEELTASCDIPIPVEHQGVQVPLAPSASPSTSSTGLTLPVQTPSSTVLTLPVQTPSPSEFTLPVQTSSSSGVTVPAQQLFNNNNMSSAEFLQQLLKQYPPQ